MLFKSSENYYYSIGDIEPQIHLRTVIVHNTERDWLFLAVKFKDNRKLARFQNITQSPEPSYSYDDGTTNNCSSAAIQKAGSKKTDV